MLATPGGEAIKLYVTRPGRFHLVDKMNHDYLVVDLFAFLHPLHTATATTGRFRIEGVPAGKVTVNTTHPSFGGEAAQEITVPPNGTAETTLTLTYKKPDAASKPAASGAVEKIH